MTKQLRASALVMCMGLLTALDLRAQGMGSLSFTSVGAPLNKRIMDPTCAFASGTAYRVALYWGAATETDDRNLTQVGASVAFLTGANAGTYFGGGRTIVTPGSPVNGPVLTFQVRGWNSTSGASYEEAIANSTGVVGKGPMFQFKTRDPNNPLESVPIISQAPGYQAFTIGWESCPIIPEPSATALTIVGAATLLLLCRRRTR